MKIFVQIIAFIAFNVAGYLSLLVMPVLFMKLGIFPEIGESFEQEFWFRQLGIGAWVYFGAAVISFGWFLAKETLRKYFLACAFLLPFFYSIGTVLYYS